MFHELFRVFYPPPIFGAIGTIIVGVTLAMSVAATGYALYMGMKGKKDGMGPESRDFNPTMAKEGAVVPIVYGTVRIPGNIIFWGNLRTEPIEQKTGGKGGMMGGGAGGGSATEGYRTYVDAWQAICMGKIAVNAIYTNDKIEAIETVSIIFNDGTNGLYPSCALYSGVLPGVAHYYLDTWYLGNNMTSMPTLHFVVTRVLEGPLTYQNLASGSNPAAVILDLLLQAGVVLSKVNVASFQVAANYWNSAGYGLNLVFDSQAEVSRAIDDVLKYVDGVFYIDEEGKYALNAINPAAAYDIEIDQDDIDDFSANRKGWNQVPNDFHGTFLDGTLDYSQRVVVAQNPAAIRQAGNKITQSLDLKCFRDATTASKRLYELMKRSSYPPLTCKFKGDLALSQLMPGDIVRLSHSDYGIVSADFRIETIDATSLDKNEIGIEAVQVAETLFDDKYFVAGGSEWEAPDNSPVGLTHAKLFELPYNSQTGFEPALLALAARENLTETKYVVLVSQSSGGDYEAAGEFSTWSQRGTLDQEYSANTYDIDDAAGIYFTAYKDDPEFDSISRDQLYAQPRIAIIGSELIAFQTVTALGGNQFKLSGCIRGVLNTAKATHSVGAEIWLTWISNNVFKAPNWDAVYYKIVPYFLGLGADPAGIAAQSVALAYKAKQPRQPGRLVATRSGSAITVQIYPNTPGVPGAGDSPSAPDKVPPFDFSGDFQVSYGATVEYVTADNFSLTSAGAVDVTVKSRLNGYISAGLVVSVGATDGEYIA